MIGQDTHAFKLRLLLFYPSLTFGLIYPAQLGGESLSRGHLFFPIVLSVNALMEGASEFPNMLFIKLRRSWQLNLEGRTTNEMSQAQRSSPEASYRYGRLI